MIEPIEIAYKARLARERISEFVERTPLVRSHHLRPDGRPLYLKLENKQITGSFKARGSASKITALTEEEKFAGVITASTGNHALGVANALKRTGVNGTIFLPKKSSPSKIDKLRSLGADLQFVEGSSLESELHAKQVAKESQKTWISPYNDPEIIAGQGTIGLELLEQSEHIKRVFATVGGGGMISGIASVLKTKDPEIEIIGCLPARSPEMYLSVNAGQIVEMAHSRDTLSDGSAGGVEPGAITFPLCQQLVDRWVLVEEDELMQAIRTAHKAMNLRIEGAAGVALAAAMKDPEPTTDDVVIICGGNIDEELWRSIALSS